MNDRAAERMYLVTAVFALVELAATYQVVTRFHDATL